MENLAVLLTQGNSVRTKAVKVLEQISRMRMRCRDLIASRDRDIHRIEREYDDAFCEFLAYEAAVSNSASQMPSDHNARISHQVETDVLRGQQETIRLHLQDASARIASVVQRMDIYRALAVSLVALVVSIISNLPEFLGMTKLFWAWVCNHV